MSTSSQNLKKKAAYIYSITFGKKIINSENKNEFVLEQSFDSEFTETSSDTDGLSIAYTMRLRGVKVNRKIYQPTAIEAELDISQKVTASGTQTKAPSFKNVNDLLLYRQVTLWARLVSRDDRTNVIVDESAIDVVASNCYVYEVTPQLKHESNGLKMYVKLSIFSMDKLMTLNPYSKAYVARKLGQEILQSESLAFGLRADSTPLVTTDISALQYLTYGDKNKEFIHPYLVQYNESFYDFMVRTANRLGEFLFFENGKLTLGLPDSGTPLEIDTFETVTAQEIAAPPLTIEPYARDSVKDDVTLKDKDNKLTSLNQYVNSADDYPDDAFPSATTSNAEDAIDEYYYPVYKDNFTDQEREMYYDGTATEVLLSTLLPVIGDIFTNENDWKTGIAASLLTAGASTALDNVDAAIAVLNKDNKQNKAFFPDEKNEEMQNDDTRVQFSTLDTSAWVTIQHLNEIRDREATVQREMICINMGTNYLSVRLGQKIKIAGMDTVYVVVQIQQTSEDAWMRNYDRYDQTTSDIKSSMRTLLIYAVPAYTANKNSYYYPPVHPVPMVRKAGPQVAFVTDSNDPKYQGRVRIAYPWQSLSASLKNALADSKQALNEAETAKTTLENKKAELKGWSDELENQKKSAEETYKTLSQADRQKKGEEEKKALDDEIKELEGKNKTLKEKIEENNTEIIKLYKEIAELTEKSKKEKDTIAKKTIEDNIEEKIESLAKYKTDNAEKEKELNTNTADITKKKVQKSYIDEIITDYDKAINNLKTAKEQADQNLKDVTKKLDEMDETVDAQKEQLAKISAYIDKDIKAMSSPWVRIATPMATSGGGAFFRPNPGDEVLVNYDNGNIERPYVVGSLYSKNVLTPDEGIARTAAPELQRGGVAVTLMSANGHHITFTDPKTGDNFFYNLVTPGLGMWAKMLAFNDREDDDGHDLTEARDLAGGIHIGDRYGLYEINMMSHKRTIDINSPFGNININAFSGITISAPNGDVTIKGKNVSIEAGNKLTLLSGKNVEDFEDTRGLGLGGALVESLKQAGKDTLLTVMNKYVFNVVDLTYIRHIVEVFVRPIDGTMLLKSKRFLMLEAGKGTATIQPERYNAKGKEQAKGERTFEVIQTYMSVIEHEIDQFFTQYETLWKNGYRKRKAYKKKATEVFEDANNMDGELMTTANGQETWTDKLVKYEDYNDHAKQDLKNNPAIFSLYKSAADSFGAAAVVAIKHAKSYGQNITTAVIADDDPYGWIKTAAKNAFEEKAGIHAWTNKYGNENAIKTFLKTADIPEGDPFLSNNKLSLKRKVLANFIIKVSNGFDDKNRLFNAVEPGNNALAINPNQINFLNDEDEPANNNADPFTDNNAWKDYVRDLFQEEKQSVGALLLDLTGAKKWYDKNIQAFKKVRDRDIWSDTVHGQILFSDKEDSTLRFEKEGLRRFHNVSVAGLKSRLLTIK